MRENSENCFRSHSYEMKTAANLLFTRIVQAHGVSSRRMRWRICTDGRFAPEGIVYEKSFNLNTISQGDFGHFGEKNLIILSKVAKIALRYYF